MKSATPTEAYMRVPNFMCDEWFANDVKAAQAAYQAMCDEGRRTVRRYSRRAEAPNRGVVCGRPTLCGWAWDARAVSR